MIALGVAFLLQQMHLWVFGPVVATFWPLLVVLIGLLAWRNNPHAWLWPAVIVLVGTVLQLQRLGIVGADFWTVFWPLLLIVLGVSILTGHGHGNPADSSEETVNPFVAFSGLDQKNLSHHFRGGSITAVFGGVNLDLTKARLPENAVIDVFAMFGGAEITVPEGWRVNVGGAPIFGGWSNKTNRPDGEGPVLTVRGIVLFGGVDVKN